MKRKLILAVLSIILVSLFSGGCWDMRELNEIGLVVAVGIDKAESPSRYSVTVQIANESAKSSGETKGTENNELWIGTAEGDSLFDATRKLVEISSRRVMWAHNNVIIIGESMAREGITPIVDFFTHNPELRMKTAVVISNGDAKPYLAENVGMETPPGISFILLEGYRALRAESVESHMLEVSASLKGRYSNPLISEISLKQAVSSSPQSGSAASSPAIVELSGTAVFRRDKMLGWLSPEESLGASWILNQTRDTAVTVTDPEHGFKSVSVETHGVRSKIKAKVISGMPQIDITISGRGHIVEEDGSTHQSINEVKKHISELVDIAIESQIKSCLSAVQGKYGVDVLDLSSVVHSQNDAAWEGGLKDRWEQIFPAIPVTVSADIVIKSSTLNQEPFNIY